MLIFVAAKLPRNRLTDTNLGDMLGASGKLTLISKERSRYVIRRHEL